MNDGKETVKNASRGFRWLSGWSRLFLEMLAITFGVLLAFALTEWRTEAKRENFTTLSLAQVDAEIERNYETIGRAYDYHVRLYKDVTAAQNDGRSLREIQFRGTQPPKLERAAYEIALGNAVFADLDPAKSQQIVATYLDFENIDKIHGLYSSGLPNLIFQVTEENDPRLLQYMKTAFMDFIFAEAETLNGISEFTDLEGVGEYWRVFSSPEPNSDAATSTLPSE